MPKSYPPTTTTLIHMLAWMDLEMTGLDPNRHVIVEVATIITDDDLNVVAEGPDIVIHRTEEELSAMDDFVLQMHTKSGLLDAIRASTTSADTARDETLAFLEKHIETAKTVPLCGNSIGTDRRFLDKQWPQIEKFLHYRSVDVSTLKELARRWAPDVLKQAPEKATTHRALDDIRESINELQYYRNELFK
jgi:oligoribonuclease